MSLNLFFVGVCGKKTTNKNFEVPRRAGSFTTSTNHCKVSTVREVDESPYVPYDGPGECSNNSIRNPSALGGSFHNVGDKAHHRKPNVAHRLAEAYFLTPILCRHCKYYFM
ncbi:uncharacterized protein LOC126327213 [Schistocerca gregaria]|uniref:uncharacterized protein LOC126327213 n=1 Tax=Schistocerca gregaria TaxID=7010 RepID=UPI00211DADC5|nr:uncharacterized protein LOC126327213 [Schistocerca gregaria]